MFRKLTKSYYTKIILTCTLLVIGVTASLLYFCHRLIRQQESSEYLADYNIVMNSQSSVLTSKAASFSDFFSPLFNDPKAYDALCELYLTTNGDIPAERKELLLNTLYSMCSTDNYCCGLLLLNRFGELYQYDPRYTTLHSLNLIQTTFRFTPYQLKILTNSQIAAINPTFEKPVSHIYGLAGTVYSQGDDTVKNLGYIIALYSTEEFSNLITAANLDSQAEFTITDREYNVIYSSKNDYSPKDTTALSAVFPADASISSPQTVKLGDDSFYISSLYQEDYAFIASYRLPADSLPLSALQITVLVLGIGISLFCIFLYGLGLRSSNKKVTNIMEGMKHIGHNNLSYRMEVPDSNDEFTNIILGFNQMCDELQRNVENTYLFEISQRKAELYAMQTSINPHFLYNALEQIRVQILQRKQENASHMLLLLSKMYRYQTKRNLFSSIAEECAQMETLINFYSYRTGSCEYEINVDTAIKKYGIPKNILQPLIENSFIHGFLPDQEDNMLTLSIHPQYEGDDPDAPSIHFVLEDNGSTITEEKLAEIMEKLKQPVLDSRGANGFALSNVNSRLMLIFGGSAALTPYIRTEGGFGIRFVIPAILPEKLAEKLNSKGID